MQKTGGAEQERWRQAYNYLEYLNCCSCCCIVVLLMMSCNLIISASLRLNSAFAVRKRIEMFLLRIAFSFVSKAFWVEEEDASGGLSSTVDDAAAFDEGGKEEVAESSRSL